MGTVAGYEIDSQSVKPTTPGPRGYDAGKKVTGRKRHAMVDTNKRPVVLQAHPACVQDRDGAIPLVQASRRPLARPSGYKNGMAQKLAWGRAWHGRSYDLGRMTLPELWWTYATYPAIHVYVAFAVVAAGVAIAMATRWQTIVLPVLAVFIAYPMAWYLIHRFILHSRWLYKMQWSAALWKRIHFDHHQDPHRLEVLFGAPSNTLPTIAVVTLPLGYAVAGWPGAAAACAAGLVTTCVYEFVHCIQHLNYNPKSRIILRTQAIPSHASLP